MVNRVDLIDISRSFGGIAALKNVTFRVSPGEIHALVGENGAGKSTLMKILSGACIKDSGQIFIDGQEIQIRNTHDSKKQGIGIIYQEFSLVPDLSVAENVFLSRMGTSGFWMRWSEINRKADELIQRIGFKITPTLKVKELNVAQKQIVEIVKALSENVKVLILDEPSAVLGPTEIRKLFDTLLKLKKENVSIIYISHHLDEVFQIADRITVLKDGNSSESLSVNKTNKDSVIRLMLGRSLDTMFPQREISAKEEVLKVVNLCNGEKVRNVSFSIYAGEIVGLAGLVGSGRSETARAVFGADKKREGDIYLSGKKLHLRNPRMAVKNGIAMVPEDRKHSGIILPLSVKENISLTNYKEFSGVFHFLKGTKEKRNAQEIIDRLNIKLNDLNQETGKLSGGNQQKVALAKWLHRNNRIILIDEPTRGIDVGAKVEIYRLITELTEKGLAILVISSETSELMGICDRIIVMRNGGIEGTLTKKEFSEESILRLSLGVM